MAIYHFSGQIITRGKGQSAVASAAYRSGEKLIDEDAGEVKFYKREVLPETLILAPDHAPEWVYDRQRLWNEVEAIEKNWNSQLAREFNIALPKELSNEQQLELIRDFAQEQFVDKGMVADIAIHRDDENNPHAHIMLTMRAFNEDGSWANKKKREYIFNENGEHVLDKKGNKKFFAVPLTDWDRKETLEKWREEWANHANKSLEKAGFQERISHLSHEARGIDQYPTVHLGHVAHAMEKEGKESERGNLNRKIKEVNNQNADIDAEIKRLTQKIIDLHETARKETKDKADSIYTPDERTALEKARERFKGAFTYPNLIKRLEQLDRFEDSIEKEEKRIYDKNTFNLSDEERSQLKKHRNQRSMIDTERDILTKAKTAYETAMTRKLASQYPDNPEIKHMNFEQVLQLKGFNDRAGRVIAISEIKEFHGTVKEQLEKHENAIKNNQPSLKDEEQKELKDVGGVLGGILQAFEQAQKQEAKERKKSEKQRYRGQKKKENVLER